MEEFEDEYDVELEDEDGNDSDSDIVGDGGKVLTSLEVGQMMQKAVQDLSDILKLPEKHLRNLLNKYNWNQDKLMDDVLKEERKEPDPKTEEDSETSFQSQCNICFATPPMDQQNCLSLNCRHAYHRSCWRQYLTIKIMDEGKGENIECPGCDNLIDDDFVMDVIGDNSVIADNSRVGDNSVMDRYWSLLTNSFVEHHRQLRWCPGKGCSKAIWIEVPASRGVFCTCGQTTCFKCGKEGHAFVPCNIVETWENLIEQVPQGRRKEVKGCPGCRVLIEKNGGCNRMKCSQCGTKFNWCQVNSQDENEKFLNDPENVKRNSGIRLRMRIIIGRVQEWWGALKYSNDVQEEPNKTFIMERKEDTKFESSRMKWESYNRSLGKAVLIDPKFINPKSILNESKETSGINLHPFFILDDLKSKLDTYASFETEPIFAALHILSASQKMLMDMEILGYFLEDHLEKATQDNKHFLMMLFVDLEQSVHHLSLSLMNFEKDFLSTEFSSHRLEIIGKSRSCSKKLGALLMLGRELVESNTLVLRK